MGSSLSHSTPTDVVSEFSSPSVKALPNSYPNEASNDTLTVAPKNENSVSRPTAISYERVYDLTASSDLVVPTSTSWESPALPLATYSHLPNI